MVCLLIQVAIMIFGHKGCQTSVRDAQSHRMENANNSGVCTDKGGHLGIIRIIRERRFEW